MQKGTAINIWGTIYIVMREQGKGKIPLAVKNDQIPPSEVSFPHQSTLHQNFIPFQ